jgi:hypothetical protein
MNISMNMNLNKYIIIIIIFSILIYFMLNHHRVRDNFNDKCFVPHEDQEIYTINNCIKECNSKCDNIEKCQKLCIDCKVNGLYWDQKTKLKKCPWLKDIKLQNKTVPNPPKIRVFPGEQKLLVEWIKPYDGNSTITNYIIVITETYNKSKGLNLVVANNPNCNICEQDIQNLKGQIYYDVFVVAVNNNGFSSKSNIESVVTMGVNNTDIIKNIFLEDVDNVDSIESLNNINMNDYKCNSNNSVNDNHMLSRNNNIDLIKSIKKIKEDSNKE